MKMGFWTPEETDQVTKMYMSGATDAEMSDALDRTIGSISGQIRTLRAQGRVTHVRPKPDSAFWTVERLQTLKDMWENGSSGGSIAKRLDCTRSAVLSRVRGMGLHRGEGTYRPKAGRYKPIDVNEVIRQRHAVRQHINDIASAARLSVRDVRTRLKDMGLDASELASTIHHVHPMWSMNDDDRRLAFYDKFQKGWAEVQKRLAQ